MSGWTAILPIKPPDDRKTRLSDRLSPDERIALTDAMIRHVIEVLAHTPSVDRVATLSVAPLDGLWFVDRGRGLNLELGEVARAVPRRLLVLHPDLPAIAPADVEALLAAAGEGAAIAPDRHGFGTNAVALAVPDPDCFAFGPDSFAIHRARLPGTAVIQRLGLGFDLDTPDDLDEALRRGILPGSFALPPH